jgi:hypothetical protein
MCQFWFLAFVLTVSGAFGGLVNLFTAAPASQLSWYKHIAVGICASLMVPLFLNTISSTLVSDIFKDNRIDSAKLFVLIGFSLVASVSSLRFIRTISDKILKELDETKEKAEAADSKASTALGVIESEESRSDTQMLLQENFDLSDVQQKILAVMITGKYTMRSVNGLSQETGLGEPAIHEALSLLVSKGYVEQGVSSKGQIRWYPSASGRTAGLWANKRLQSTGGAG